ncbi:DUF4838 domain-containing protein, partial [Candidatus Kaiserbacteria bacterium]|nr:DUF4838 domain-containing protein [Candidatus Kaiserbacteria bacterium]
AGVVNLAATASSTSSITGVQFKLDGVNLGPKDTIPPYTATWNSASSTGAWHAINATASDAAGNVASTTMNLLGRSTPYLSATPAPGTYKSSPQTIYLSASTTIRYRFDTLALTCTSGTVYTAGISVSSSTIIRAIACKGTKAASPVTSFTYDILNPSLYFKAYGGRITVVGPAAATSSILKPAVADLQKYLKQMTGSDYTIGQYTNGPGIQLFLANSPNAPADAVAQLNGKGYEAFVIRGVADLRLMIIANNERGLSNGIYYYLEQLGVRWLMQGDNWTIVPNKSNVMISINKLVEPSFSLARRMSPTGADFQGWSKNWASNIQITSKMWVDWTRRLRTSSVPTGADVGAAFVAENWQTLQDHPDYFAKVNGAYVSMFDLLPGVAGRSNYNLDPVTNRYVQVANGTGSYIIRAPKLNAGNPSAVNFFCTWVLNRYRKVRNAPGDSIYKWTSVEPSDGYGYGNNYAELQAQGVGDGSASDQTFFIANKCAQMVRAEFSDASVILLAYAGHATPPSISLEPNVIVEITPYRFQPMPTEDFIAQWQAKATTMAAYDYWTIPVWSPDWPSFDYLNLTKTKLQYLYANNVRGLTDETTSGGGAMGIGHYVAEHLMWDINLNDKALIDEWYTLAFGPAKAPMKRMMERWALGYRPGAIEWGTSYQDINQAEQLAAGNTAVQARVDDYARYLRHLQLSYEASNAPAGLAERSQKAIALAEHIFDINDSGMIYTTYMFDNAVKLSPSVKTEFDLTDPAHPGPGWVRVHDLSHAEIMSFIADGMSTYPPPDFTVKTYTGPLVPLHPTTWQAPTSTSPWGQPITIRANPSQGAFPQYIDVQIPNGLTNLPLQIAAVEATTTLAIINDARKNIYAHSFFPVATTSPAKSWGTADINAWQEVNIPLAPGHYQIRLLGGFRLRTWKGIPLSWQNVNVGVYDQVYTPRERFYFYVPLGTQKIAFYRITSTVDPLMALGKDVYVPKIYDPSGTLVARDVRDQGKVLVETVGPGQDGKIWSVTYSGPLFMLNTPQSFSLDPQGLMVPSDAR